MKKETGKKRGWLKVLMILLILVALFFVVYFSFINISKMLNKKSAVAVKQTKSDEVPVRCVSDANAKLEKDPRYNTEILIGMVDPNKNFSGEKTSNTQLKLASYENSLINLKEDLFFIIKKDGKKNVSGIAGRIELCDKNNMTRPQEVKEFASDDAIEKTYSVHSGIAPKDAGDYRADAYLYDPVDKKWYLTDRIDKVTFVK